MLGCKERDQLELFISGSQRQLVPDDHVLARVDRVLDLTWLRAEVAQCYCHEEGRPGIDPEVRRPRARSVSTHAGLRPSSTSWSRSSRG